MTALSELLTDANTEQLSARAIARRASENGYKINHDTAARYLRGDHGRPDEATLVALSEILNVPLVKLRLAADLPAELTTPYAPPAEASRLSRRQRLAVDEVIRSMLDPGRVPVGERGHRPTPRSANPSSASSPTTTSAPTQLPARRAARHGKPEKPEPTTS